MPERMLGWTAAILGPQISAASFLAQVPARLPNEEGVLVTWGISAGIVVVCCLASFLNPKRSHLA